MAMWIRTTTIIILLEIMSIITNDGNDTDNSADDNVGNDTGSHNDNRSDGIVIMMKT